MSDNDTVEDHDTVGDSRTEKDPIVKRRFGPGIIFAAVTFVALYAFFVWFVFGPLASSEHPQNPFDPQGSQAQMQKDLIMPIFLIAGFVGSLVIAGVVFISFAYRRRPTEPDADAIQREGNNKLEIGWTIVPTLVMIFVAAITIPVVMKLYQQPGGTQLNAAVMGAQIEKGDSLEDTFLNVDVVGHQWWFEYRYQGYFDDDTEVVTANELVIPAGATINLTLRSGDVIHSFWVPELAGKIDAVPGQDNYLKIQANEPGVFYGQCAEYCGEQHANMRIRVIALDALQFDEWISSQTRAAATPDQSDPEQAEAAAGHRLFLDRGCAGCHTVAGYTNGNVGPNLTHLFDRSVFAGAMFQLDEQNLRAWLQDPQGMKPGSYMMLPQPLTEAEITQLIAYLETLRTSDTPTAELVSGEKVPE